jgi:hypothetical protein
MVWSRSECEEEAEGTRWGRGRGSSGSAIATRKEELSLYESFRTKAEFEN